MSSVTKILIFPVLLAILCWFVPLLRNVFSERNALEICGIAGIAFCLCRFCVFLYEIWFGHILGHTIRVEDMGKWAVITGSTDGIGKALAYEVAKRKVNVVLISLTPEKLQATADDIKRKYNVETKVIAVDFRRGYEIYEGIKAQLEGLEIGCLFNNVGTIFIQKTHFHKMQDRDKVALDAAHCNIFSMQFLTNMILPQMVQRNRGLIANIGSLGGVVPFPFMSTYGATKAYIHKYSQDLSIEYANTGVHIQSFLPGSVATKMNPAVQTADLMNPTAEVYSQAVMRSLGMSHDTCAYFPHCAQRFMASVMHCIAPTMTRNLTRYFMIKRFYGGHFE